MNKEDQAERKALFAACDELQRDINRRQASNVPVRPSTLSKHVGKRLGRGMSRDVFVFASNPAYVVKFEKSDHFQNAIEFVTTQYLENETAAKWFAHTPWVSACGRVSIMRRTFPITRAEAPKLVPIYLCDFKLTNFGWLDGRVVCHDYGTGFSILAGLRNKEMQKPRWHDPARPPKGKVFKAR